MAALGFCAHFLGPRARDRLGILARSGTFTPFQLPALSAVLERIWSDAIDGDLWINTGLTLYRALVAFAICAVGGVLIGMAMSRNVIRQLVF